MEMQTALGVLLPAGPKRIRRHLSVTDPEVRLVLLVAFETNFAIGRARYFFDTNYFNRARIPLAFWVARAMRASKLCVQPQIVSTVF